MAVRPRRSMENMSQMMQVEKRKTAMSRKCSCAHGVVQSMLALGFLPRPV